MNAMKRHALMNMNKHEPTTIFDLMTRPLSDFENFFNAPMLKGEDFKVNLADDGDHYELTAELPGVKKEDVKVHFDDGMLTISAEKKTENEKKDERGYVVKERSEGSFSRSFYLEDADEGRGEASFENGVLKLTLGKKASASKKVITIK